MAAVSRTLSYHLVSCVDCWTRNALRFLMCVGLDRRNTMCEWLSNSEWCDVKLVCGGQTFNAHRAVLASVSIFLRRVLLSCPQEDTPVFIVLPDFDLEAMSSVLYYVYNGEVFIDNHKLFLFLDIIKTLEIFIDHQFLKKLQDTTEDRYLDHYKKKKRKSLYALFNMNSQNKRESSDIEKYDGVQDKNLQYLLGNSDLSDKRDICLKRSELHPYLDRQRNSFLRDLYIETYPQNGNVNVVTGGVLAISNEPYRVPTSVLLTNANGKHPIRADDRLSATRNSTESELPNISRKQYCVNGFDQPYNEIYTKKLLDTTQRTALNMSKSNQSRVNSDYDLMFNYNKTVLSYKPSYTERHIETTQEKSSVATLDLSLTESLVRTVLSGPSENANKCVDAIRLMQSRMNNIHRKFQTQKKDSLSNFSKVPIFNQVIDSPWRPRVPINYKPLRRKGTHVTDTVPTKKETCSVINDSNNNNLEETVTTPNLCAEETSASEVEYKCSICSQVFTNEDSLSSHTKRHTTTARYTCSECGKTFSQLRNFKYHVSVHRGTREFAATCTVCGKYFNDRGYLSSHMKIHRNRKEYKCSLCPKSFNQRVAYNMHVRIHTGVKPHVCEECGKAFSRKMLLKQHQRTHSGERPYACPHCDKRFADRSNMTLHLRLHTGVKPFSCSLCPKSFTKKHHLKSHLNFHTGAKPYSCPRCQLAFTQSSNMRTHLKKCIASPEVGASSN